MTPSTTPGNQDPLFAGLSAARVAELRRRHRVGPDLEEMLRSGELQRLVLDEPRVGLNLLSHLARGFRELSAGQPTEPRVQTLPTG